MFTGDHNNNVRLFIFFCSTRHILYPIGAYTQTVQITAIRRTAVLEIEEPLKPLEHHSTIVTRALRRTPQHYAIEEFKENITALWYRGV